MQVCAECGRENPEGFRHCGFCGAALTAGAVERRKLATLVFCDVSGSTAMGERADAEAVRGLMRSYFQEVRAVFERHGGTVEKFIGDAVVAAFGVPLSHEDDALRACRAALEIRSRLAERREEFERRFGSGIAVRIGVNTGEVVAGDPSDQETFVTGNAVNVAARLEQAAEPGEVLVGEPTYRLVRKAVTVAAVQPLLLKGKSEPLPAYRLLAVARPGSVLARGSPLVGRGEELAVLEGEFDAALADRNCRLVTVAGEPGVGKSRLAAELVDRVGSRARVVRGACLSYGEGITFWAVAQIVRDLAGIHDEHSLAEARALLDGVVERLENGPAVAARIAQLLGLTDGSATADQMAHAIALFLAAAADGPLVVLVDDIHWAEPALLDLLAALPTMVENAPLLLVCLARTELLEQRPEWPPAVALEPLGEAEVDAMLGSLGVPAAVRARLAQAAAGNPLFAEELVAMLVDEGALRRNDDGSWVLARELDRIELPASLNGLLGARLDRLDARARDALERGAVEGELFHRGAVVELSERESRPAVAGGLEELTGKDMIRPAAASFAGEIAYRFKHILVREAAYRGTAKRLRTALHERFAEWLERLVGERVGEYREILGYHLEQAYRYRAELGPVDADARDLAARAGRHLGAAGRRASDRGDVYAAANLLGRATALLPADSLERLELMDSHRYAVRETGRGLEARAIADELYERATALGERRLAAQARSSRTTTAVMSDPDVDLDEARAIQEEAVETFTELGDEAGLASSMRGLAMICTVQGRHAEAGAWFERALVHANACGDLVTRRIVTQALATGLPSGPMPVGDAIGRCEELREADRGDRVLEAVLMRVLSGLFAMAGRFEDAREYERESSRVLDAADMLISSSGSRGIAALARELAGDRAGAERELQAQWLPFRDTLGGSPDKRGLSVAYRLANLYCDDGRWDDAEDCLAFYRDVSAPNQLAADRLALEARLAGHRGELVDAVMLAKRAVEGAEQSDNLNLRARVWLARAEVERARGAGAEADAAVVTALELYEEKGNVAAAALLRAREAGRTGVDV